MLSRIVHRDTQDGENVAVGLGSARWTRGRHTVPVRASTRPARANKKQPSAGLGRSAIGGGASGRWPGPRPRGNRETTVAGSGYGLPISRRANTSDPIRGQHGAREPEYPRGELCHRVWHHWDAHRVWNPTASAVGGGQTRTHQRPSAWPASPVSSPPGRLLGGLPRVIRYRVKCHEQPIERAYLLETSLLRRLLSLIDGRLDPLYRRLAPLRGPVPRHSGCVDVSKSAIDTRSDERTDREKLEQRGDSLEKVSNTDADSSTVGLTISRSFDPS